MTGSRGAPVNEERQLALLTGELHYTGKRCKKCGCTTRYAKGGSCVECTKSSADEIRAHNKTKAKARERYRLSKLDDLSDLLGETGTEVAQGACSGEDVEGISESPDSSSPGSNSLFPSEINTPVLSSVGVHSTAGNRKTQASWEQPSNSDDEPMASPVARARFVRYFCHSESGCVWKSTGPDTANDATVEEISEETFNDLVAAGFTISGDDDDLDDILG